MSNVSWTSLGPLLKYSFCDSSQSSGIASPFQIPIAHFDQNRTVWVTDVSDGSFFAFFTLFHLSLTFFYQSFPLNINLTLVFNINCWKTWEVKFSHSRQFYMIVHWNFPDCDGCFSWHTDSLNLHNFLHRCDAMNLLSVYIIPNWTSNWFTRPNISRVT